jgi:hypothetical protein
MPLEQRRSWRKIIIVPGRLVTSQAAFVITDWVSNDAEQHSMRVTRIAHCPAWAGLSVGFVCQ